MSGNIFGRLLRVSSFGESHGEALGGLVEGIPPNFPVRKEIIQAELDRRRPGRNRYVSPRDEPDSVHMLSGLFQGKTLGSSIGFVIYNRSAQANDYAAYANLFRPGHADKSTWEKYRIRDHRGGGRSSGRETLVRVAAGSIASQILATFGISVVAYLSQVGSVSSPRFACPILPSAIEASPLFCPDPATTARMLHCIETAKARSDSIGAEVTIHAYGVPAGLGEPVFDKLDAALAHALMGIGGVKSVAIGDGERVIQQRGSTGRDLFASKPGIHTHAGGILGGISTGDTLVARIGIKPTSSIAHPTVALTTSGEVVPLSVVGRHDPCIGIRIVPVAKAMVSLVLLDYYLQQQALLRTANDRSSSPTHS